MKTTPQYEFTEEQKKLLRKAKILEWCTIVYLITVGILMYLVMGKSQAMKTAWIEDLLSIIPPFSFLIGSYFCWKKPNKNFPYGYHRVISIAFLCAALALLTMGFYLLSEALYKLFTFEHPTVGLAVVLGHEIWLGWLMILILIYGVFPPIFLGRAKMKIAPKIFDKILYTDAKMNKADWLTSAAAIIGVLGIGIGWWWLDGIAAAIISLDILYDGIAQTKDAVLQLMDHTPTNLKGRPLSLPDKIISKLHEIPWVSYAEIRLHDQGHLLFGEGFLSTKNNRGVTAKEMEEATKSVEELDWRLQSFVITLIQEQ